MDIFLLFLPWVSWVSLSIFIVASAFLGARVRRLRQENQQLKVAHAALQENWMRECERRAIAEEKASRIPEVEKLASARSDLIDKRDL